MIYSMTGFGKSEGNVGQLKVSVQMRSLNSKMLDLNLRVPAIYKELEGDIRKLIAEDLQRGKVEISTSILETEVDNAPRINKEVFSSYLSQLKVIAADLDISIEDPVSTISRFPDVFKSAEQTLSDSEKKDFIQLIEQCILELKEFRRAEGSITELDLRKQIDQIRDELKNALNYEEERIETVRNRIRQKLEEYVDKNKIDNDRLEQELIYYLEKFDVSEEKVRLQAHCDYFIETLESDQAQGKKLNFIAQEIGREINTLGSKANHAEMQKHVVLMKESLEKIKEQVLNVL